MDTVPSATSVRFLSTPSARRATAIPILEALATGAFLSTPSVRRATFGSLDGLTVTGV